MISCMNMGAIAAAVKSAIYGSLWYDTSELMPILSNAASNYHSFTGTATTSTMGATLTGTTKWYGGVLGPDGKIYCVPLNATSILIIDPIAGTATTSAMGATLTGATKWFGGVLGPDGKIYCVPLDATSILIISKNINVSSLDVMACLSPHLNKL